MRHTIMALAAALTMAMPAASPAFAQDDARVNATTFDAPSLAGNLEGNSVTRDVLVVTPPGYDEHPDKRYPVVYFLHGYWMPVGAQQEAFRLEEAVDAASRAGNDMIVVMPDGFSKLRGGFYSSGPVVGDYEGMVARDLVAWVDANYRTLPTPASRGLAGHSMGGYGTIRIAMKHPGIFSSIYMMSACCLPPQPLSADQADAIDAMGKGDLEGAQFGQLAGVSTGAAWAPDPGGEGAFMVDTTRGPDGGVAKLAEYRMAANSPLVLLPQYLPALNALEGFAIDIGDEDFLLEGNRAFMAELDRFSVDYDFELYEGDHGNRIRERIRTEVLPFFAEHLDREGE